MNYAMQRLNTIVGLASGHQSVLLPLGKVAWVAAFYAGADLDACDDACIDAIAGRCTYA